MEASLPFWLESYCTKPSGSPCPLPGHLLFLILTLAFCISHFSFPQGRPCSFTLQDTPGQGGPDVLLGDRSCQTLGSDVSDKGGPGLSSLPPETRSEGWRSGLTPCNPACPRRFSGRGERFPLTRVTELSSLPCQPLHILKQSQSPSCLAFVGPSTHTANAQMSVTSKTKPRGLDLVKPAWTCNTTAAGSWPKHILHILPPLVMWNKHRGSIPSSCSWPRPCSLTPLCLCSHSCATVTTTEPPQEDVISNVKSCQEGGTVPATD